MKKHNTTSTKRPLKARILPARSSITEPLTAEEAKELHGLIEEASKSNHNLIDLGTTVDAARAALADYERQLQAARAANSELHARIAAPPFAMNIVTQYDQLAAAVPGLRPGYWLLLMRVAEHEDGVPLTRLYHGGHCTAPSAQIFFRWAVSRGLLEVRARLHGTARGVADRRGRPTVRVALTAKALKLLNQERRTANPEPS